MSFQTRRVVSAAVSFTIAAGTVSSSVSADPAAWPEKPLTMLVGFAAGGSVDSVARVVAQGLEQRFGRPVMVINKPGASGGIAAAEVAAATDGHTILVTPTSLLVNHFVNPSEKFSIEDLRVANITSVSTTMFVVNAASPATTLAEFLTLAETQPLSIGTSALGSASNITADYFFKSVAKSPVEVVPYPQTAQQAITDLLGNHIDALSLAIAEAATHVESGSFRVLAVSGAERSRILPEAPTLAEAGFPGVTSYGWTGVFMPAATDPEVLAKLNAAVNETLVSPAAAERLDGLGFERNIMPIAETKAFFEQQYQTWETMLRSMDMVK
jgi:tripartite-type tricarboxylate transporter receptor subunit TctC